MRKDDLIFFLTLMILSENRYGRTGLLSGKTEALYSEPNERTEAATSSYSAACDFLQYISSVIMAKNHQKIRSRCLVFELSFEDIF